MIITIVVGAWALGSLFLGVLLGRFFHVCGWRGASAGEPLLWMEDTGKTLREGGRRGRGFVSEASRTIEPDDGEFGNRANAVGWERGAALALRDSNEQSRSSAA